MCFSTSVFRLYYMYYDKTVDKFPLQNYEREINMILLGETIELSATKWKKVHLLHFIANLIKKKKSYCIVYIMVKEVLILIYSVS